MSTLHTVNKSPFSTQTLLSCLNHCKDGDAVLMIEDGVYGALASSGLADAVRAKAGSVSLYVIVGDAEARGIAGGKLLSEVTGIGYDGFVDLVAEHDRTQAWL
uniref:Intracellular sulfur oxidation protein DsrH n=1 Tax=uncultured bacterium ws101A12 TaxID=1131826 RepID=I1X4H1_9BACT|nr:intracellular sulfur oxidation protein DsrH [uncultured bacterium ws101A12]